MSICEGCEIHAVAHTDVGRVRSTNEDSLLVADLTQDEGIEDSGSLDFSSGPKGALFAVADGMGGAAAGELASRLCLQALYGGIACHHQRPRGSAAEEIELVLAEGVRLANQRVYELSQSRRDYSGMGTTLTAAFELHGQLGIGQVGDSRAYLIREREVHQLTRDQTLVTKMVEGGQLTEEEARRHSNRNVLLQAVGTRDTVELALRVLPVRPSDILVLCTDGLHTQISAEEVCGIVLGSDGLQEACLELVDLANGRGGPDNITCVLVEMAGNRD
jgi:protein phosphatase